MGLACTYVSMGVVQEPTKATVPRESDGEKAAAGLNDGDELERPQSNGSAATRTSGESLNTTIGSELKTGTETGRETFEALK